MTKGPKKHLKRVHAPKSWMLSKLGGTWAQKPSCGPHKGRESIPLSVILKHRLKYALNGSEITSILNDREGTIKVDNKIRRDKGFPCGFMDVLSIEKTGESFRILFDVKGRFVLKSIKTDETKFKLLKIKRKEVAQNKIPYIVTHDARTLRYQNPDINVNDTIKFDIEKNKVLETYKFEIGNVATCTGGNNIGRIGII